jgi:hypothetical protein
MNPLYLRYRGDALTYADVSSIRAVIEGMQIEGMHGEIEGMQRRERRESRERAALRQHTLSLSLIEASIEAVSLSHRSFYRRERRSSLSLIEASIDALSLS